MTQLIITWAFVPTGHPSACCMNCATAAGMAAVKGQHQGQQAPPPPPPSNTLGGKGIFANKLKMPGGGGGGGGSTHTKEQL